MKSLLKYIHSGLFLAMCFLAYPCLSVGAEEIQCYQASGYFVVAKSRVTEAGNNFLIKYLDGQDTDIACEYLPRETDFEIRNEWAAYFASLIGDRLYLEHYTGPGPYTFSIWDLTKRQKVFEAFGSNVEYGEDSVSYWMKTGKATKENCPDLSEWESHGLGGAIETRVNLELVNFEITETEVTRCSARQ